MCEQAEVVTQRKQAKIIRLKSPETVPERQEPFQKEAKPEPPKPRG
jgi:hypothetical protein